MGNVVLEGLESVGDQGLSDKANPMLQLDVFQALTAQTDRIKSADAADVLLLGLFGEIGSLLSELKKKKRDVTHAAYKQTITEEVGDALWYFASFARRSDILLSDIATKVGTAISSSGRITTFQDLDRSKGAVDDGKALASMMKLAAAVGQIMAHNSDGKHQGNSAQVAADLHVIFRAFLDMANNAGISLEDAARDNQKKTALRWPQEHVFTPLFDESFPAYEQLPRRIEMDFKEIERKGARVVIQQMNGINIGDPVTDNAGEEDHYRFHDVFHLSYAAFLGWSPVLRSLLKLKRKSVGRIDEVEDGARATIIEEAVSNWVFNHAKDVDFFSSATSVDYRILKLIAELVRGQEVEKCPFWQWEKAILEGFRVFRLLRDNRGGKVIADLNARTLTIVVK
jgi:NTP pyrophosphatase (non-canonical NTP hydrolase)